jgi:hypothetical protein
MVQPDTQQVARRETCQCVRARPAVQQRCRCPEQTDPTGLSRQRIRRQVALTRSLENPSLAISLASLGDGGHAGVVARDLTWDAVCDAAKHLNLRAREQALEVVATRKRSILFVTEGLWVGDKWTDVFEAVRRRPHVGRGWRELQSVQEASSRIGRFLRERPDLGAHAAVTGTPDSGLEAFRTAGSVTIVSAETQQRVAVPVEVVEPLDGMLGAVHAAGEPGWFSPEPVRDDLRAILVRAAASDRAAVEAALAEVDYACSEGSGVAVIPPSS